MNSEIIKCQLLIVNAMGEREREFMGIQDLVRKG